MSTSPLQARMLSRHLEPITALLQDAEVSEILINGPDEIFFERNGTLHAFEGRYRDDDALMALVVGAAQLAGHSVSAQRPIVEARLPDGSRFEAVTPPAAPAGPLVAIRRFRQRSLSMEDLLAAGAISPLAARWLHGRVHARANVLVCGGTGSGKTSMLNLLGAMVPARQRVVVLEDSRELRLDGDHVVYLQSRPPDANGRGEVSARDLFRATLRLRPDRIVIGEIRGAEALELVQAMTSGHGGSLSSLHASSPTDALSRLETMALMSDVSLPLWALRAQIGSAVDVLVQLARLGDGRRAVTQLAQVMSDPERGYTLRPVFQTDSGGRLVPREAELKLPAGTLP